MDVRLAFAGSPAALISGLGPYGGTMTDFRLSISGNSGDCERRRQTFAARPANKPNVKAQQAGGYLPALLVSYVYLKQFRKLQDYLTYRDWAMDSGAFSVWRSGYVIDLAEYIDICLQLLETDALLTEVFSLDVINDDANMSRGHAAAIRQSRYNLQKMWDAGVPAIPTFHVGAPWEWLREIAAEFPKIAVGGMIGRPRNAQVLFLGQVFREVWPKKIHGFGLGSEWILNQFPFHSVDSTSWESGPCMFGRWKTIGAARVRGSSQNIRMETDYYMALERKLKARWRKEMKLLDDLEKEDDEHAGQG